MAKRFVVVTVLFVGFVGKAVNWGETQEQKVERLIIMIKEV